MPFFIPLIIGASTTGYLWYQSTNKKEETTFKGEFLKLLYPALLILVVVLFFRWLYLKGSKNHN